MGSTSSGRFLITTIMIIISISHTTIIISITTMINITTTVITITIGYCCYYV